MKTKTIPILGTALVIVLILVADAAALSGKEVFVALPLLVILFSLFEWLIGVAAVIGAAIYAREHMQMLPFANLVAGVGGAWSAYKWFGWPLAYGGSSRSLENAFSFGALLGCVFFALVGIAICSAIAKSGQDAKDTRS
jgi:hypothetical protein